MVHYKLSYFDVRALAEPIRIMFAMFDVPYEDHRVSVQEWAELKKKTPFGQMPVLEVDGVEIGQSAAIGRFLARKFGLAGQNALEEALADGIVDQFKDFIFFFRQWTMPTFLEGDPAEIKRIATEIVAPARDTYLGIVKRILEKSTSGFLVGNSLTWADLVVADNLTSLVNGQFIDLKEEKTLAEFYEKIHSIPKIKEYVAKRKHSVL